MIPPHFPVLGLQGEKAGALGAGCGRLREVGMASLPSALSGAFPPLLAAALLTVSEDVLSLVLGSRLGLGGGCLLEPQLLSSSVPPTECRDCDLTVKPLEHGWGSLS
jgi:hypothetical protein